MRRGLSLLEAVVTFVVGVIFLLVIVKVVKPTVPPAAPEMSAAEQYIANHCKGMSCIECCEQQQKKRSDARFDQPCESTFYQNCVATCNEETVSPDPADCEKFPAYYVKKNE